ncbi:MAG: RNA polymerase sigma factor [Candidatus Eisenbacteria bacterium]|nr:sigma-70 family RNA polymerase sigma factor [Candidatus Eisenbacteria bacterium]
MHPPRRPAEGARPASNNSRTDLETTRVLLDRIRSGDDEARNRLIARFLPGLRRWAHGRLPAHSRGLMDTDDVVQTALLRALNRVGEFEAGREGAFLSYLHQILINVIRDEIRRAQRHPIDSLDTDLPASREQVLERTIGHGALEAYDRALASLSDEQRQAVILRIEFGFSHPEIAQALGRSSANAVRMQIARAIVRLTEAMHAYRPA